MVWRFCSHAYIHMQHVHTHMQILLKVTGAFNLVLLFWYKPEFHGKVRGALSVNGMRIKGVFFLVKGVWVFLPSFLFPVGKLNLNAEKNCDLENEN